VYMSHSVHMVLALTEVQKNQSQDLKMSPFWIVVKHVLQNQVKMRDSYLGAKPDCCEF
jgi:hypothetical protein